MYQKKLPLVLRWFYMLPIDAHFFIQTFFVMYVTTSLSLIENPSCGTLRKSNNAECLGIDKTFWVLPTTVAQPEGGTVCIHYSSIQILYVIVCTHFFSYVSCFIYCLTLISMLLYLWHLLVFPKLIKLSKWTKFKDQLL